METNNVEIIEEIKEIETPKPLMTTLNNLWRDKAVKSSWDKVSASFLVLKRNKSSLRQPSQNRT